MKPIIPREKLSKEQRCQLDLQQLATWGALNPVTRKPPTPTVPSRFGQLVEADSANL